MSARHALTQRAVHIVTAPPPQLSALFASRTTDSPACCSLVRCGLLLFPSCRAHRFRATCLFAGAVICASGPLSPLARLHRVARRGARTRVPEMAESAAFPELITS
ncbi:hypothetical protein MRX96_013058 [Rhipicephalus microplus]